MTDVDPIQERAQELLDAILPRRSPQYAPALTYLMAYLGSDDKTRRLAMKALRMDDAPEASPAATPEPAPPPTGTVGAMAVPAPPPAQHTMPKMLRCRGSHCYEQGGREHHVDDGSCTKYPPRAPR